MEKYRPIPKEELKMPFYAVFCQDEEKYLYISSGKNREIEGLVAEDVAFNHANDTGHRVYIFEDYKIQ